MGPLGHLLLQVVGSAIILILFVTFLLLNVTVLLYCLSAVQALYLLKIVASSPEDQVNK